MKLRRNKEMKHSCVVLAQVADADVGGASGCKKECTCRLIDEAKEKESNETFMRGPCARS